METLTFAGFLLRLAMAVVLVFATYNPTGYAFAQWLARSITQPPPLLAVCGLALLVGWIIFLRATLRAMGLGGVLLVVAFLGALIWLFSSWGWLDPHNSHAMAWVGLSGASLVLAIGVSWSHLRRRLTGQADVDEVVER